MKYLLLPFLILVLGCSPKELPTSIQINDQEIVVMLSHQSIRMELDDIQSELAQKYQCSIDFSGSTFFEDGRLRDLSFTITDAKGQTGKANTQLGTLQYAYFGFRLSIQNGEALLQKVGTMP